MRAIWKLLLLLIGLSFSTPIALSDTDPAAVRAEYNRIEAVRFQLQADIAIFRPLTTYQCPPASVSKQDHIDLLQALQYRHRNLNGALNRLRAANATAAQAAISTAEIEGVGLVTDNEFLRVQNLLNSHSRMILRLIADVRAAQPPDSECDPTKDPITTVNFTPRTSADPGTQFQAQVSARTSTGKAAVITGVRVIGANAFAEPGAAPYTVFGLGTQIATINFNVATIRQDRNYAYQVIVTGRPVGLTAPGTTSATVRSTLRVNNVAPTVSSAAFTATGKPGESVSIEGDLVIVDRNADRNNPNELHRARTRLTDHPLDLKTTPRNAFNRWSRIDQTGFDPSKGEYTFKVHRTATLERPHAHGVFKPRISISDWGTPQNTTFQDVEITVENVPPVALIRPTPKAGFHALDGIPVGLVGRIRDDNGADDIEDIRINAVTAGGNNYALASGTVSKVNLRDDGFDFVIDPDTFNHTTRAGRYTISATAEDGPGPGGSPPNVVSFNTEITVGNDAPEIGTIGYMTGTETIILKEVCPRDVITVGARVNDRENDAVKVTATILPGGQPEELKIRRQGDKTYTLVMLAPAQPGEYRIVFHVEETDTTNKKKATTQGSDRELILKVLPCGQEEEDPPRIAGDPVPPINVAIGGAIPGGEIKIVPQPPGLPGEPDLDQIAAIGFAHLFGNSWLIDTIMGVDPASDDSVTSAAGETFFDYVVNGPLWEGLEVLEHAGGIAPGGQFICVGGLGTSAPVSLQPNNQAEAIQSLFEINRGMDAVISDLATGGPILNEWRLADSLNLLSNAFGDRVPEMQEGEVVPRQTSTTGSTTVANEAVAIGNEIDDAAWAQFQATYGFDADASVAAQWRSWLNDFTSSPQGGFEFDEHLLRNLEFSLLTNEIKWDVTAGLLEDAEPGSSRADHLREQGDRFWAQWRAAEASLGTFTDFSGASFSPSGDRGPLFGLLDEGTGIGTCDKAGADSTAPCFSPTDFYQKRMRELIQNGAFETELPQATNGFATANLNWEQQIQRTRDLSINSQFPEIHPGVGDGGWPTSDWSSVWELSETIFSGEQRDIAGFSNQVDWLQVAREIQSSHGELNLNFANYAHNIRSNFYDFAPSILSQFRILEADEGFELGRVGQDGSAALDLRAGFRYDYYERDGFDIDFNLGGPTTDGGLSFGLVELDTFVESVFPDQQGAVSAENWDLGIKYHLNDEFSFDITGSYNDGYDLSTDSLSEFQTFPQGAAPLELGDGSGRKITYFTPRFAGFQLGVSYAQDALAQEECWEKKGGAPQ